jgi:hypothetical protein
MPADVDGRALSERCREHLGALVAERVFTAGHLSAVYGLRLVDGREVVLKVRGGGARLGSCIRVQRRMWEAGFCCPEPLAGPHRLGLSPHRPCASMPPCRGCPPRRTTSCCGRAGSPSTARQPARPCPEDAVSRRRRLRRCRCPPGPRWDDDAPRWRPPGASASRRHPAATWPSTAGSGRHRATAPSGLA